MSSESSYTVPPCLVEVIPLPLGEVEVGEDGRRAVFRGDIEIRCTYPERHRVILPRRSTVPAVYTMHVPEGYELRPIPPPAPISDRYRFSVRRDFPAGTFPPSVSRGTFPQSAPQALTVRTPTGPSIPGFARSSLGRTTCECFWCLEALERQISQSVPVVRDVPRVTPGSSSRRHGRDHFDGDDTPGPSRRPRLSVSPTYSPAPLNVWDQNAIIFISSSEGEKESEEDPDEDSDV